MAKKKAEGYLSAKTARQISRENRRITNEFEKKRKRKNVPESEYLTTMRDPANAVEFDDLHTYFFTDAGTVKSVDGVTFDVPIGKTVGVVGESGCGKSVTSLSLMQLVQRPQGQIVSGAIRLNLGDKAYDISQVPVEKMQDIRGKSISMIFQEPMTSLNPVKKIGWQVGEALRIHTELDKAEIKKRVLKMLELVELPDPELIYEQYPHELSGGMRQRVMIASAMICKPKILIADEPTTALDVTIQAQIVELLRRINRTQKTAILFISHDLSLVRMLCERVAVMQQGRVVESGRAEDIFLHPQEEYTKLLIAAIPKCVRGKSMRETL